MAKHSVRQRQGSDCVIASIATVTGSSYAQVRKLLSPGRGLARHESLWLVNHWGGWRLIEPRKDWTIAEWAKKYPRSLVVIGSAFSNRAHMISVVEGIPECPSGQEVDTTLIVSYGIVPM